jgi:hypothetical protein
VARFQYETHLVSSSCNPRSAVYLSACPGSRAQVIRLVTEPNRNYSGFFYNDDLATRLAPTGDLGKLVFSPVNRVRIWVVDTAFIDDVIAMKSEYKIGLKAAKKLMVLVPLWQPTG